MTTQTEALTAENAAIHTEDSISKQLKPSGYVPLYITPPQRKPLTNAQLEKGRGQIFSINNPFCPCDSKTFRKVARWVEASHDIKE